MPAPLIETDDQAMAVALSLAAQGLGRVAPNPSVGCVIVRGGAIIAGARTADGGRPHAEEAALSLAGDAARGAVAFITLEPCARRSAGTEACADRLVRAGVARVVVACADPHPNAAGAGLARLRAAGIAVELGCGEAAARALNAGFFSVVERGRPWIAIDADPTTFDATFDPTWDANPAVDLLSLMSAMGALGITRLRIEPGSALASALRRAGLVDSDQA